jgi:putative ABC transport system ATP-binding protein
VEQRLVSHALQGLRLSKRYVVGDETIRALDDVTLEVPPGEFVAVMGPSGSGKSTLLHLLGLLDNADGGEVLIRGERTDELDDDALTLLRRDRLGFVFQSFELIPNLSAAENILLPAEIAGRGDQARVRMAALADTLGISDRLAHRPRQLSGGQRQRVALARALINDPVVVLADEPTGNLDSQSGNEVLDLLQRGVTDQGWTVVMVTHDPNAAMYAHRIVFLRDGRLSGQASTKETDVRAMIEAFVGV